MRSMQQLLISDVPGSPRQKIPTAENYSGQIGNRYCI